MSYATPAEFVSFIKKARSKPYAPGSRDKEFDAITKKDLEQIGIPFEPGSPGLENLERVIDKMFNNILEAQPQDVQSKINRAVAAGVLETGLVNAFIARGRDGNHAVIVNSGLMVLLNKAIKLWVGGARNGGIVYCNRMPAADVTADDISQMLTELFTAYRLTGIPRGPMVKVSDECIGTYSMALNLAECFVICHELGHFLNGDLDKGVGLAAISWCEGVEFYKGDSNHEKEHNADVTGYELLQRYVRAKHPTVDDDFLMFGLITVMDMIGAISREGSPTHPDARDRVIFVARHFYGDAEAEKWRISYENSAPSGSH